MMAVAERFEDLMAAVTRHREALAGAAGEKRREAIARFRLAKTAETLAQERLKTLLAGRIGQAAARLVRREGDPYTEAEGIVREFTGEKNHG